MIQSSNKEGQRESMGNSQSRPLSFGRVLKANDFDQQTFKINIRNMADEVYELDEERFYLKYLILFLLFILYGSIIAAFTTLHMQKENNIPYLSTQTQNNYIPSTKSTPETQKYRTPTIAPTQTKRPQPAKNYTYTSPKIQQNQTKSQYQHRYRRPVYQQKNILPKQQKIYETQVSNHSRTSQAHSQSSKKFLSSPPSSLNQARSKQQPNSQYSNISNHLQSPQHSQSSNYSKIPQNSYASHVQKNKRTQELSKLQQSKHLNESQPSQQFQSQHSKLQEQSSNFQEPPKSNYQVNQKSTQPQQSSESSQYQIKDTLLVNKNEQKNVIKQNNGLKLKNQRLIRHLLRPKAMIQPPFGGNFYQVWQQVFRVQCRWQSLALREYVKKWATSPKYRKRTLYRKFLDYWKGYDESKIPEQEFYYRWHPRWNGLHKMLQNGSYWHANGNKLTVFTTTKINVDDYSVFQLFPLTWMGIWLPPDIAQNEVITIEGIRVKLNFKTMKDRPFLIEQIGKIYVNPTEKERRTKDKPIFRQFICHDGQDFCNEKYTQIRLTFVNDVRVYHIKIDSMYMVGFNFWGKYGPDQDQDYY